MAEDAVAEVPASEQLARRWFDLVQRGALDRLREFVHPHVVIVSRVQAGLVVEGRDDFVRFVDEILTKSLYQAVAEVYRPLDDRCVVVEGRMRWLDDDHVMRDDPVTWALEFEEGLLLRFIPTRTPLEAETILAAPHSEAEKR